MPLLIGEMVVQVCLHSRLLCQENVLHRHYPIHHALMFSLIILPQHLKLLTWALGVGQGLLVDNP